MADPISLTMLAATAAGAGISAYGQYQGGQAQARMAQYQAGVNQQLAAVAARNAIYDIQSGEVKAQQAGLVSRAAAGRLTASAGARNIGPTTGSTAAALQSQVAIGRENQAIQRADAAHAAYGEQVQAAEKTATAGAYGLAAQTAVTAGDISALGSIATGVGSVAGKWYDVSSMQGPAPANVNPDSPEGRVAYNSSITYSS